MAAPDDKKATGPPPFDPEAFGSDSARKPSPRGLGSGGVPLPPVPPPRPPPQTFASEEEVEVARLRSMSLSERPTPNSSASLLSLANAYASVVAMPAAESGEAADLAAATAAADDAAPATPSPSGADVSAAPEPAGAQAAVRDPVDEMRDRYSLGDYTGALDVAEALLQADPSQIEASRCAESSRAILEQMYSARIGPLERVPVVAVAREQLRWLSIDHRAGFVLSHVDGVSSLEMILDVSGMPTLDVLRILFELVQQRIITFR